VSWAQLQEIVREAKVMASEDRSVRPSACPNDGEPLVSDFAGQLVCPYDGWRPGADVS
jgi:hypothetical protein